MGLCFPAGVHMGANLAAFVTLLVLMVSTSKGESSDAEILQEEHYVLSGKTSVLDV